jgi:hypothetical protein
MSEPLPPTWAQTLPKLIRAIMGDDLPGKRHAIAQLYRLAEAYDAVILEDEINARFGKDRARRDKKALAAFLKSRGVK